ncbi:Eco57I restriction-modification methylase domain-containing protein [Thiothrix subterranea]|uniref:site-specific DNA-methyltransferase (adenine-specific) n=1 Tax=Thiothrix subterranea TaxID=2735563 RepID=A0AA51R4A0_9GAMM|nr:DNA methyltransferase [Thiothrix subterranea]MDQ5770230.1 Eco57I restriction-modification methylase domain-containing protein [Thiothrix subterranea]WML86405.1 Eco57I restriction-modification methylase domain-containing protein [Thiothrix subterranea]
MTTPTPLFSHAFLMACWSDDYTAYCAGDTDSRLLTKLTHWAEKDFQHETGAEGGFLDVFFVELWGYARSGKQEKAAGFTLAQQFAIEKAGQNGGVGKADAAMGWFGASTLPDTPQILCEFKDIRSALDAKQNRKGNDRSPVQQCADYLHFAKRQFTPYGSEKIQPIWGIVSDMNEFRLYWNARMPHQYERFVIKRKSLAETGLVLLDSGEKARQQRFLFSRLFHADWLLNRGSEPPLLGLLSMQRIQEKALEKTFYFEYRAYRDALFKTLLAHNPAYQQQPRQLVRLTQKLLDRLLFVLFCEDMGAHLQFPVNLLSKLLSEDSQKPDYLPDAADVWNSSVLPLFKSMRNGGIFRSHPISRFNGGLFAADSDLDDLHVPNRVFFVPFQGADDATLLKHKDTLLYFSANYNFGIEEGGERAIGLYTLGRIFEQSITDLEIMEAEAANQDSLMKLSKRKTDGVYYTPEWVTAYIVEETLGLRLRELRAENGQGEFAGLDAAAVDADHFKNGKLKKNTLSARYCDWLDSYQQRLSGLKVLDPACGSGAFLIQALKRLLQEHEWLVSEKSRVNYEFRQVAAFDKAKAYREILAKNLYGVDVNAESVEITKLALWLHTVMPGQPLSSLDGNILCGNSLVDWDINRDEKPLSDEQLERINPFSYREAFAEVFAAGGFDVIIGNPPYIKLQNMRRIQPEATDYWVSAKNADGSVKFRSVQTGNYDIYLPFIEQSVGLLHPEGRMGLIAPNVWAVNDYGQGLREVLHETRRMDRWIDFKSYQIFDEAITYTALQFFTGKAVDGIKLHFAPNGGDDLSSLDWSQVNALPYDNLPTADAWQFMPEPERRLIEKLNTTCKTLEQSCAGIAVGIQTSADNIYHLTKISAGKYVSHADKQNAVEVEIEDDLMHPLVSGVEAKRYQIPQTDTYLLFPYDLAGERPRLFSAKAMQECFPNGWKYLRSHEASLRKREGGKFDIEGWYQFGRNQNIDKQEFSKLLVPRLVKQLFCTIDADGDFYLDNVDVGSILVADKSDLPFLAGILNAPVANFIWRRISKPFQNDYRTANKQFIAPLPIPNANDEQKKQVAELAETLQELHTAYRDELQKLAKRLSAAQMTDDTKTPQWIWATLPDDKQLKASDAAKATGLKGKALTDWAKAQYQTALAQKLEKLTVNLNPSLKLTVRYEDGELSLLANGTPAFDSLFIDDAELIAVQWKYVVRSTNITPSVTAEKLLGELLKLKTTDNDSLRKQIIALDKKLDELQAGIEAKEREMNALVYGLYGLTRDEVLQVERG